MPQLIRRERYDDWRDRVYTVVAAACSLVDNLILLTTLGTFQSKLTHLFVTSERVFAWVDDD